MKLLSWETVSAIPCFCFMKYSFPGQLESLCILLLLLLSRFSRVQLCDPIDGSPPGSAVPGIFQARVLEWGATAFSRKVAWILVFSRASRGNSPRSSHHQLGSFCSAQLRLHEPGDGIRPRGLGSGCHHPSLQTATAVEVWRKQQNSVKQLSFNKKN